MIEDVALSFFDSVIGFFKSDYFSIFLFFAQFIFVLLGIVFAALAIFFAMKAGFFKDVKRQYEWFMLKKRTANGAVRQDWPLVWNQISESLNTRNQEDLKNSIIEIEKFVDNVLGQMGVHGSDLDEKLQHLTHGEVPTLNNVIRAHSIVENIKTQESAQISYKEAQQILNSYEEALKSLGALPRG